MIDGRGLSSPEPVILVKKAMDEKENPIKIVVDSKAALEEVMRFANLCHYQAISTEAKGEYTVILKLK